MDGLVEDMMARRLPLVGMGAEGPPSDHETCVVDQALVVVPAYPTAPVWLALERVSLPIFSLAKGDVLQEQDLEAPRAHKRIEGPREKALGILPSEPFVLVGETAAEWVSGGLVVVVAGVVGRSAWSPLARRLQAGLVLRSIRPGTLAEVERRFLDAR